MPELDGIARVKLAVIADDLTGALDAVVPFAMLGMRCVVATGPADVPEALQSGAEVVGVSTQSRDVSGDMAKISAARVATALCEVPLWFKKIDSRLKGNIAAEVAGLLSVRGFDQVLICPAIPQMGRIVGNGTLQGFGVPVPLPVAAVLAPLAGLDVIAPDVRDDADVDFALEGAGDALLVGARGLSAALARRMAQGAARPPFPLPLPQPIAIAIGSRDPITLAQVAILRQHLPSAAVVQAPNGRNETGSNASIAILQATPGIGAAEPEDVTHVLAAAFVRGFVEGRSSLVLAGGETAAAVLSRMGVRLLEVLGEALPGLPVTCPLHKPDGPFILTKSGGFGGEDTLYRLIHPATLGQEA